MLSPTISVNAPEGPNSTPTSSRRRALSYFRVLAQGRNNPSPEIPRLSTRPSFQRSISYTDNTAQSAAEGRRRSASRPSERAIPQASTLTRTVSNSATPQRPEASSEEATAGQQSEASPLSAQEETASTEEMARNRTSTRRRTNSQSIASPAHEASANIAGEPTMVTTTSRSGITTNGDSHDSETKQQLPTIRFFAHQEMRNGRQSLNFAPVARTLPDESAIIRVGRYSEREGIPPVNPTSPSEAPVGFKSKVVSRKHCEFCFVEGLWHIRDVGSSSGTFLNHIRLSQPNTESKLYPIKDGDIVQLGIDFRGGEEMIFRCVKIRIECNRTWQKKPNTFNKNRHAQLRGLATDQPSAGQNSGECSICLCSILPCQPLFVAPCAHVWHYKCIRPMLEGKDSQYPAFQCPNCRAWTDLEAEYDIAESDVEEWKAVDGDSPLEEPSAAEQGIAPDSIANGQTSHDAVTTTPEKLANGAAHRDSVTSNASSSAISGGLGLLARRQATNSDSPEAHSVNGIEMPQAPTVESMHAHLDQLRTSTATPTGTEHIISGEGPLTPRNNAGPFVFDGSAGRGGRNLVVPTVVPEENS